MSQNAYGLIGLDLGTTMLKAVMIDLAGTVVSSQRVKMLYQSYGTRVEFDVNEYYQTIASLIRKLIDAAPAGMQVLGISVASASGNTVLLDQAGTPLRPAISWLDQRASDELDDLFSQAMQDGIHQIVGWPYLKSFPLAHMAWLKSHEPQNLHQAATICLSTDYVMYRLTGEWGIDPSTATSLYLQDQVGQRWHQPYLDALEIDVRQLPPILATGSILGHVTDQAAVQTGLPAGLPVVMGAFDHPCAARGAGIVTRGQAMISAGTSWVIFLPEPDRNKLIDLSLICDPFLREKGLWGGMASLPAISRTIDDLIRRWVTRDSDYVRSFTRLACQAPAGAGGLTIDLEQAEAPRDLSQFPKTHIARAIMEGTATLLVKLCRRLQSAGMSLSDLTMVGGAAENRVWSQIVCNLLGQPITAVDGSMTGAIGASILAGQGVDAYQNCLYAQREQISKRELTPE